MPVNAVKLILASSSKTRHALLKNAGVTFEVIAAKIDESQMKLALKQSGATAVHLAETLAEMKAVRVSQQNPSALVIGSDQTLDCEDIWYDKPLDAKGVHAHLLALRAKTHRLNSAACVVQNGQVLWHHNAQALLTMRDFSDEFISFYVKSVSQDIFQSVGGYQLEGMGAQLFSSIKGDYFTILGLPLLPLLQFLRQHGMVKH